MTATAARTNVRTTTTTTTTRPTSVFRSLAAEWERQARGRRARAALAAWAAAEEASEGENGGGDGGATAAPGVLGAFGDLFELVEAVQRGADRARADRVLAALVARARSGDELATATVVHALTPGCLALAGRLARFSTFGEAAADVAAQVVVAVRTYPLERRPRAVAANVLLDCAQVLTRAGRKSARRAAACVPFHEARADDAAVVVAPSAGEEDGLEGLLAWAVAEGHLCPASAELIRATRLGDVAPAHLAALAGVEPQTLRRRRQRAEARLASAAEARLAEALAALAA